MKAIFFILSVFVLLSGYSQSNEYLKIDSIHISKVTLEVTVTNIGKKGSFMEVAKVLKEKDSELYNQIFKARSCVSILIDSNNYYAPLLNEDRLFDKLIKNIDSIIEAQLLKIECYRSGKIEIYFLFVDFKY